MTVEPAASVRVDQWLWAVRLLKTRSESAATCRGGHVDINGRTAKPASPVRIGDRVEVRVARRNRIVQVARLVDKRVGAPVAVTCFVDHTPPAEPDDVPHLRRDPGAGRPTKRDRRRIDEMRRR